MLMPFLRVLVLILHPLLVVHHWLRCRHVDVRPKHKPDLREGGREAGRETGRQGGREAGRERERGREREGEREREG
jgi:hypothetical protein